MSEPDAPGPTSTEGVRVTVTDLGTGQSESQTIWDDYVLVCAGSCFRAGVQAHGAGGGTHRGRRRPLHGLRGPAMSDGEEDSEPCSWCGGEWYLQECDDPYPVLRAALRRDVAPVHGMPGNGAREAPGDLVSEPAPEPELPGGVLGYAVAVHDAGRWRGFTHTTPLTLREAQRELRHWQRRARPEDKGWLSYEVCEVRRL